MTTTVRACLGGGPSASGDRSCFQTRVWWPSLWHRRQRGGKVQSVVTLFVRRELKQRPMRSAGRWDRPAGKRWGWRRTQKAAPRLAPVDDLPSFLLHYLFSRFSILRRNRRHSPCVRHKARRLSHRPPLRGDIRGDPRTVTWFR
jgi:hypothetical protein